MSRIAVVSFMNLETTDCGLVLVVRFGTFTSKFFSTNTSIEDGLKKASAEN